jgi:anaerobic selenocysteine-containing dehydrogenase
MTVAFRTCPLCEATCGLAVEHVDNAVTRVRGDDLDAFSGGFMCPKGVALKALHEDPDRVRVPLIRERGSFRVAGYDEAFRVIADRLQPLLAEHGRDACAVYLGNPNVHNLGFLTHMRAMLRALGTHNVFSGSTLDQYPKQLSAALMFGTSMSVPVPDLDRTDFLLMLGANPAASNGSLMTAPNARGRLRKIRNRGGKVVVIDPRRTRTAADADEHLFIRPGTDAMLLMALVNTIFAEGLEEPVAYLNGLKQVRELARDFTADRVAPVTRIDAEAIRRLARELAQARSAAVYGRLGTTAQPFGAVCCWLIDVLNAITGNLDRPGGAMFATPAAGAPNTRGEPGRGPGVPVGRWRSRVRGLGEIFGELPAACMAEEIDTPGAGRVRALITIAGNPARSVPNSGRLVAALESLELMISIDAYVNETTRHADVILPAPSPLERSHYDLMLYAWAVRNVANYSPAVVPKPNGLLDEWQVFLKLAAIAGGDGADADIEALDAELAASAAARAVGDRYGPLYGRDPEQLLTQLAPRGPERLLDLALRNGPYQLTLADLEANPHGIDLGPLVSRLPEVLRTPSGMVELAPPLLTADVERLKAALRTSPHREMLLIGRRDLRSNNSWMHNLELLVSGPERCAVLVHPDDAERLELCERARVSSPSGAIELPVHVTDEIMPGVVSIPHGWGHDDPATGLRVATRHAGVNSNVLADDQLVDPVSGNAVLNGIPVEVSPVTVTAPAPRSPLPVRA